MLCFLETTYVDLHQITAPTLSHKLSNHTDHHQTVSIHIHTFHLLPSTMCYKPSDSLSETCSSLQHQPTRYAAVNYERSVQVLHHTTGAPLTCPFSMCCVCVRAASSTRHHAWSMLTQRTPAEPATPLLLFTRNSERPLTLRDPMEMLAPCETRMLCAGMAPSPPEHTAEISKLTGAMLPG